MNEQQENNTYLSNYLGLLNLRLYTLLQLCPAETRTEARSRMAAIADPSLDPDLEVDPEEAAACEALTDMLAGEHKEMLSAAQEIGTLPRIEKLREIFGLDAKELLILTAVIAAAVDGRFRNVYRLFQNSEDPRMDLLLSLIDENGISRYVYAELLGNEGKLLSRSLIETVGNVPLPNNQTAYRLAPGLLSWLNGAPSVDAYNGRAEWMFEENDAGEPSALDGIVNAIEMAEKRSENLPLVSFYGPDDELLTEHAKKLGSMLERPLLMLDFRGLAFTDALPLLRMGLRDAALNEGVVVIRGMDQWIDSSGIFSTDSARILDQWNVPVVMLTKLNFVFSANEYMPDRLILRIPVGGLTGTRRFGVWKSQLAGLPLDDSFNDDSLRTLAGQFTLNTAQIRAAVNAGLGKAVTEDRDLTIADLYEGARVSSMHHLSDLAKKMDARYTLKDLILPEKQTREIDQLIAMARNRSLVLEDWGVGEKLVSGRGISALFTGVPGTGKTLTAQVIAGELGLELYRVDLSTVVSKYIGETEKNLERIFTEAQNSNVILFFDEADSLFGRRSEVGDSHDRYANIEVGYLLQRIETYDGIVLMATNLGANLDEAFARRINFIIDFPFPDEETRLRLWELLLPENIEKEGDINLWPFAVSYKIAGGNIRNAVVWAIYEAARNKRPLTIDDLMNGVEREYAKMGKVFQRLR